MHDDRLVPRVRTNDHFFFIFSLVPPFARVRAVVRPIEDSKTRLEDEDAHRKKRACTLNRRIITGDFTHTPRFDCATRATRRRRGGWARYVHTIVVMGYSCVCVCIGCRELFVCVCVRARAPGDRPGGLDDCPTTTASRETVTRSGLARERCAGWFLSRVFARINARGRSVGDVDSDARTRSIEPALARGTKSHGNLDASGVGGSDRR